MVFKRTGEGAGGVVKEGLSREEGRGRENIRERVCSRAVI